MSDIEPFQYQRKAEIGTKQIIESPNLEAQKCHVKVEEKCAKLEQ